MLSFSFFSFRLFRFLLKEALLRHRKNMAILTTMAYDTKSMRNVAFEAEAEEEEDVDDDFDFGIDGDGALMTNVRRRRRCIASGSSSLPPPPLPRAWTWSAFALSPLRRRVSTMFWCVERVFISFSLKRGTKKEEFLSFLSLVSSAPLVSLERKKNEGEITSFFHFFSKKEKEKKTSIERLSIFENSDVAFFFELVDLRDRARQCPGTLRRPEASRAFSFLVFLSLLQRQSDKEENRKKNATSSRFFIFFSRCSLKPPPDENALSRPPSPPSPLSSLDLLPFTHNLTKSNRIEIKKQYAACVAANLSMFSSPEGSSSNDKKAAAASSLAERACSPLATTLLECLSQKAAPEQAAAFAECVASGGRKSKGKAPDCGFEVEAMRSALRRAKLFPFPPLRPPRRHERAREAARRSGAGG